MVKETALAFAHPEARAAHTPPHETPRDRISLGDHIVEADIGAFQIERGVRQRLRFNIVVEVTAPDAANDDVDRILSYDALHEAIAAELAGSRLNLLETLAENVAARILHHPQAWRIFVRIEKLDRGPGALGVEIMRRSGPQAADVEAVPDVLPRVIFISNAQIQADDLPKQIDAFVTSGQPIILCVDAPEHPVIPSANPQTQRRIDLLAIEQNAWRLAARDPRCTVVATRTELNWAARNGQISVWAPSKMVVDAPELNGAMPDPQALAAWLAQTLGADSPVETPPPI